MVQRASTIVIAAVAGLAGAALAPHLFSVVPAYAQQRATAPQIIQGKSFVLLDEAGRKRGDWYFDNSGQPALRLYDEKGSMTWSTPPSSKLVPLTQR